MAIRPRPSSAPFAVALAFALGALAAPAAADTLTVPGDHATIQAAIDAAVNSDEVLVSPGTYVETIDFLGKAITVRSTGGAAVTTIDAGGAGSAVRFDSFEPTSTLLEGFTITGGTGTMLLDLSGGGILIQSAAPTIRCCTIRGNSAEEGGGVYITGPSSSEAVLQNCVIESNSAATGGGIWADFASPLIEGCVIRGNTATGDGGGFYVGVGNNVNFELNDSIVEGNQAARGGGGYTGTYGIPFEDAVITRTRFIGNEATDKGGGLYMSDSDSGFAFGQNQRLSFVDFIDNTALSGGGAYYSGGSSDGLATVSGHFDDCLFAGNVATGVAQGGGLYAFLDDAHIDVNRCTFADNDAGGTGGALCVTGPDGQTGSFRRSIVWGNGAAPIAGSQIGTLSYSLNDIEGGLPFGPGSIDADPLFVDPPVDDYHLMPASPASAWGARPVKTEAWSDLGRPLTGEAGFPLLAGSGPLLPGVNVTIDLTVAAPSTGAFFFLGLSDVDLPLEGGTLVPDPIFLLVFVTDPAGEISVTGALPPTTPPGLEFYMQFWMDDPCATRGYSASNGLRGEVQ